MRVLLSQRLVSAVQHKTVRVDFRSFRLVSAIRVNHRSRWIACSRITQRTRQRRADRQQPSPLWKPRQIRLMLRPTKSSHPQTRRMHHHILQRPCHHHRLIYHRRRLSLLLHHRRINLIQQPAMMTLSTSRAHPARLILRYPRQMQTELIHHHLVHLQHWMTRVPQITMMLAPLYIPLRPHRENPTSKHHLSL